MSKPLIIVESPTKIRTIKKYLGNKFNVTATVGHIRDLPPKEIGIDIEKDFKPKYVNIKGKSKTIKELKAAADNSSEILLAPDPDREGEAIAYHTASILKKKGRVFHRILFHELTKKGIAEAIENTIEIDLDKFNAQQARRILDRLVGYKISPLLWKKVQSGLSAGRVQSVSVRIICDREKEIQRFIPEEYWSLTADLSGENPPPFNAKLVHKDNKKIDIKNKEESDQILSDLNGIDYVVDKIQKKTTKRNPYPPFITSKMQQDAINKLRFSAKKTMIIAQQLYEGIDLGPGEPVGLITYMRTDSLRVSDEANNEALTYIDKHYGKEYANPTPRHFKNKNKSQDGHEAIRPTSVLNSPENVKPYLTKDQYNLYNLIWKRFVASQMAQALINQNSVKIAAGRYTFSVSGSTIKFPGFMKVYSMDDQTEKNGKKIIPELTEGNILKLLKLNPKQHFTTPPPRFSEASLVKELEENGIGRPSTYAAIISTIRDKGYVVSENRYFRPTELGFIVNDLLVDNFPEILNIDFTAGLESDLDMVEAGDKKYLTVLKDFYKHFESRLEKAKEGMVSIKGVGIKTELPCPDCGSHLNLKVGKNGSFVSCSKYPECSFSRNYDRDEKGIIHIIEQPEAKEAEGKFCDKCGSQMLIKHGRYGEFLACSKYPECKHTLSLMNTENGNSVGVKCPEKTCDGDVVEKKSKRGKVFYGCNKYPDCTFASWDKPVDRKCPQCNALFLVEKSTKKDGTFVKCVTRECGFKESLG